MDHVSKPVWYIKLKMDAFRTHVWMLPHPFYWKLTHAECEKGYWNLVLGAIQLKFHLFRILVLVLILPSSRQLKG